ncbi:M48 family metalloprotease [Crateriforma conspicua]|uniref:M48 family metalloprotease n=1 Tax=Crateriforma conspicua TaxID=2527996 RepID=UPI0011884A64|nr:M48 family metalloprotease [Crateriforma conspicua]QDV64232.1 Peptidase family M48 [Crateriforma conspicua]
MSLLLFLVVIISLGCGTLPPIHVSVWQPFAATAALVGGWALLCHVGVRLIARQAIAGDLDRWQAVTWMERQLAMFRWLTLPAIVLCLGGFGLGRILDDVPVTDQSMAVRAIVLLLPGLLMIAATYSAENYYGALLGYDQTGWRGHVRYVGQLTRTGLAWLVLPVVALMGLCDLVSWVSADPAVNQWLMPLAVVLVVVTALPLFIRRGLKTEPMDPARQKWVAQILRAVHLQRLAVRRWDTGGTAFNAMVAGMFDPLRTMLVSDRLLDRLPDDQIAMVVLHEAAHVRRRHVPLRMLSVLPAWGAGMLVTRIAGQSDYAVTLGTAAGILFTVLILRIVSYRTERDADLYACRLAAQIGDQVPGMPSTVEQAGASLSAALTRITADHPSMRRATWLHPGLEERLDSLRIHTSPKHKTAAAGTMANPAMP